MMVLYIVLRDHLDDYITRIATAQDVRGYTTRSDRPTVYAAYRDGTYELCTPDDRLTDTDGDLTNPQWFADRGTILAQQDRGRKERYDIVEVDPESGAVTPLLDDPFRNSSPRPNPADPTQLAFVSNRDRSLDLYTLDIDSEEVDRRSETDAPVWAYGWAPDGDALVYQAGKFHEDALRIVDVPAGTDSVLVDEPASEQALGPPRASLRDREVWSSEGILFTTNHETGYHEVALADPSGVYELRHITEHDTYGPQWTPDGDIVVARLRRGNHELYRLDDDGVTTIESLGTHRYLKPAADGLYYWDSSPDTAGDIRRDGKTIIADGTIDVPTVFPDDITYTSSDGQEIAARHYIPEEDPIGAVVYIHGGPANHAYNSHDWFPQTFVQAGLEVLAPDYRGSIGYGRAFRTALEGNVGNVDLADMVAGAAYLREERNHERVGAFGGSYGGYLTLLAVSKTGAFDAGASAICIVNLETFIENTEGWIRDVFIRRFGGPPDEIPEFYAEQSPLTHVEDITVPLLIAQGANDPRVPQSEAEQLVASLEERDIPHEYLLFENEGHSLVTRENRIELLTRAVSLFQAAADD